MTTPRDPIYAGHRYPAEIISYAVWLYFRFPLSLRMVEEMLAARGISVTHETIRQWGLKFGQEFVNRIRRRAPLRGDKWHLDGGDRRNPESGHHGRPRCLSQGNPDRTRPPCAASDKSLSEQPT